jgi:inhibitor of cysteine peptidase
MDKSVSTPQCGRFNCKPTADGGQTDLAAAMSDLVFQAEHNGKVINVPVGHPFHIRLEESPTTGYKWSVASFDASCLKFNSDEYTPHMGAGIGGGGIHDFEFAATSACRATIRLIRKRPWESGAQPQATFEITVVATP